MKNQQAAETLACLSAVFGMSPDVATLARWSRADLQTACVTAFKTRTATCDAQPAPPIRPRKLETFIVNNTKAKAAATAHERAHW